QKAFALTPKEFDRALNDFLHSRHALLYTMKAPGAIEEVTFEFRHMKDFETQVLIADMHEHSPDHLAEAQQEFQRLAEQHPESAEAQRGLGIAYLAKEQYDQAEEHFRKAAALGTRDPRVYYNLGYFLMRKLSNSSGVEDPEVLVDITNAINKAIDLDPEYADAYNIRAFALSRARNYAQAITALKTAIRLDPRNEQYKLSLADQYMASGKYDEAIAGFEQLRSSPNAAVARIAAEQMETAKAWKDKPMLSLAALPD